MEVCGSKRARDQMPALVLRICSEFEIGDTLSGTADAPVLRPRSDGLKRLIVLKKRLSLITDFRQFGAVSPLMVRDFGD
jgi:hypothetical protein